MLIMVVVVVMMMMTVGITAFDAVFVVEYGILLHNHHQISSNNTNAASECGKSSPLMETLMILSQLYMELSYVALHTSLRHGFFAIMPSLISTRLLDVTFINALSLFIFKCWCSNVTE